MGPSTPPASSKNELVSSNRIRTLGVDLAYDAADPFGGVDQAGATLEQGLSAIGAVKKDNLLITPADATPQYLLSRLRLGRSQSIFGFWISETIDGQVVLYGLPPAPADCTYGGPDLGKGYDVASFASEECIRGGLTLYRTFGLFPGVTIQPKVLVDGAVMYRLGTYNIPNSLASRTSTAESGGLGFQLGLPHNIAIDALMTFPFGADAYQVTSRSPGLWFDLAVHP